MRKLSDERIKDLNDPGKWEDGKNTYRINVNFTPPDFQIPPVSTMRIEVRKKKYFYKSDKTEEIMGRDGRKPSFKFAMYSECALIRVRSLSSYSSTFRYNLRNSLRNDENFHNNVTDNKLDINREISEYASNSELHERGACLTLDGDKVLSSKIFCRKGHFPPENIFIVNNQSKTCAKIKKLINTSNQLIGTNLIESSFNSFLEKVPIQSKLFSLVFYDTTSTLFGQKTKKKMDPIADLRLLIGNQLMADKGLLVVTFSSRIAGGAQQSQMDCMKLVRTLGQQVGYNPILIHGFAYHPAMFVLAISM